MILMNPIVKDLIQEEIVNVILERCEDDLFLLSEGLITEENFIQRLLRKGIPYATALAIAAGSISPSVAQAGNKPVAAQTVSDVSKEGFMRAFEKAYPQSKNKKFNNNLKQQLSMLEKELKGKIALEYLSKQRRESFVRFMQDMPKFKNAPKEEIISKFFSPRVVPKALKTIETVSVEMVNEGEHTPRMYRSFMPGYEQSAGTIAAAYDEASNKIIINPYEYLKDGKLDTNALDASLREEIYHAIDYNLSTSVIPMSKLQTKAAQERGIFVDQENSGMSKQRYDYLTQNHEFYAKMLRLKDFVADKYPDQIDEDGKINKTFLKRMIDAKDPTMFGDANVLEIIQVLDSSKIDQIQSFFDLLAKKVGSTSQQTA